MDLHLSEVPDRAELSRMARLCGHGLKRPLLLSFAFTPSFHLLPFRLTVFTCCSAMSDSLSNVSRHLANLGACARKQGVLPWQEGSDEANLL